MGLYPETDKTARIIFASVAMLAATAQLRPAFSGESAAAARSQKTKLTETITSPTASQQSAPALRTRQENNNPATGTWNRTPSRCTGLWTSAQVDATKKSNIRFASASGTDDGEASVAETSTPQEANNSTKPADSSLAAAEAAGKNATSEETPPPASSSASIKEQLLNAMRMQRETMTNPNALKSTIPSGSLTIMNSPPVTPKPPSESGTLAPPISSAPSSSQSPTSANQTKVTAEVDVSVIMQPNSPKSNTGLTRTLEEDLKSNDAYLRERAQRFLRLQMNLQQLRSRPAAAADNAAVDTAAKSTTNGNSDNSTSVNPSESGRATHPLIPSGDLPSGSNDGTNHGDDTEQQRSHESASAQNLHSPHPLTSDRLTQPEEDIAHEIMSEESTHESIEPSANAALIESVVVNGPIDRLGLANNLFAIGEYPLALEMYQQTAGPELSSQQQFWVEFQTASCLRHLGNPAEASNRFRKLASQPEAGWLSKQAQRWVEHLESIRILEKSLKDNSIEQWQKFIEDVEAAVVEPPAQTTATSTVSESSKNPEPAKDEHTH
jgi:tetratricopeptide (TPR) repeat protein